MGTHPIFESDFDCLTEMLSRITRIISRNYFFSRRRFGFFEEVYPRFKMKIRFIDESCFFWQYNLHEGDSRLNFYEKFDRRKFGPGSICKEINNPGCNKTLFDEDLASWRKNFASSGRCYHGTTKFSLEKKFLTIAEYLPKSLLLLMVSSSYRRSIGAVYQNYLKDIKTFRLTVKN